ncbi:MAG: aminopeptidase P family protein [Rhodobacteraceae bacterium]|nr:aminopeptidase P family protein [Paracoccaceae bacterium]
MRHERLRSEMAALGIDMLFLDQPEMIFHAIGYAMSEGFQQFCVIPATGDILMILRSVDRGTCLDYSALPAAHVIGYADWEDPIAILVEQIKARGLPCGKIAVDRDSYNMTLNRFQALRDALPETKWHDFSALLRDMRAVKSADEIKLLQRACDIADQAIAAILRDFRPGDTDRDCVAMAAAHTIRLGGDAGVVGPVTKALTDSRMHALVEDVPLEQGDILHVELIPQYYGYSARIMRPVFVGVPDDSIIATAALIVEIQDRQIAAMRTGARASDVDAIMRDGMLKAGLKTSYQNVSGYSLGYYQQFTCRSSDFTYVFRPGDDWCLKRNMVFHMYAAANGLAFSETVQVTDEGGVRLTQTPRKLLRI